MSSLVRVSIRLIRFAYLNCLLDIGWCLCRSVGRAYETGIVDLWDVGVLWLRVILIMLPFTCWVLWNT